MKSGLLKENDFFETSDLNLANCLCFFNRPIEAINWENNKATFLFQRDKNLDDLIQRYWRRELFVEPVAFLDCLRTLKTRLYHADR